MLCCQRGSSLLIVGEETYSASSESVEHLLETRLRDGVVLDLHRHGRTAAARLRSLDELEDVG